eukprot:Gb_21304 [translate_table: standard]
MLFPFGWNWATSLLLGGLLSATDPLAVVALLKELGISKKLSTIIEGESLMNDGSVQITLCLTVDDCCKEGCFHLGELDDIVIATRVSLCNRLCSGCGFPKEARC